MSNKPAATASLTAIIIGVAFFPFGSGYIMSTIDVTCVNGTLPTYIATGTVPCSLTKQFRSEDPTRGCSGVTGGSRQISPVGTRLL
jgi:hypothetical protein